MILNFEVNIRHFVRESLTEEEEGIINLAIDNFFHPPTTPCFLVIVNIHHPTPHGATLCLGEGGGQNNLSIAKPSLRVYNPLVYSYYCLLIMEIAMVFLTRQYFVVCLRCISKLREWSLLLLL